MMECWMTPSHVGDEFEKLMIRLNPPRVKVDNETDKKTTLIKVDSANKRGSLLDVLQVLNDLNLIIKKAYISSDGVWFMDVFHVTDELGNKVYSDNVSERIQKALEHRGQSFRSMERSVVRQPAVLEHTAIELLGRDRPGLLSDVFAVLTDLKCNIVSAEIWTHNSRMASVVYITDEQTGLPIEDPSRLNNIKMLLLHVLKGSHDWESANTAVSVGVTHAQRRLHQMLYEDRDYDDQNLDTPETMGSSDSKPAITVENWADKGYTMVIVKCRDRPKLLFDTVCTITDMQYVIFHGTIKAEGPDALQEYYIRHRDGCPISCEAERERLMHCLEAALKRRSFDGIRLELRSKDRVGLLSEVTRAFRENGLSVARAEVTTRESQAVNTFYVTDASGVQPVKNETIEAVKNQIGMTDISLKEAADAAASPPKKMLSLGNMLRSKSEKFLCDLGLLKSRNASSY